MRRAHLFRRRHTRDLHRRGRVDPARVRDTGFGWTATRVQACSAKRAILARRQVVRLSRAGFAGHGSTRVSERRRTRAADGPRRHRVRHLVGRRTPSARHRSSGSLSRSRLLDRADRRRRANRYRGAEARANARPGRHCDGCRVDGRFDLLYCSRPARHSRVAAANLADGVRRDRFAGTHDSGWRVSVLPDRVRQATGFRWCAHGFEHVVCRDRPDHGQGRWTPSTSDPRYWIRQSFLRLP